VECEDVRKCATTATLFCEERCGVRLAKVWGMRIPRFGELIMALTIKEIENAKASDKKYKLADGGGLCLLVLPSGSKLWLWRYRFDGIEKNMTLGEYPVVTLKDAREHHFAAKKLLASGINPMAERKAEAEAKRQEARALEREADSSFEKVARKWWSIGKSPRHAETLINRLEADVFPVIGHVSIDDVL